MQTLTAPTLRGLLELRQQDELAHLATRLHASEWVDLIHQLDDDDVATLLDLLPAEVAIEILAELDPESAAELLADETAISTAAIISVMEPDDAADVVAEMDDDRAAEVLSELSTEDASVLRELLTYEDGTAGALMTPAFVAIAPTLTAEEAIEALRSLAADAEVINYVYVLDRQDHLLGVLSLRNLVLAQPGEPVQNLMIVPAISVTTDVDVQDAANLLRDRNLLALPVVDGSGRLQGVITHDDATEVLENEITEDFMKLAGTDADEMARRNPLEIASLRMPWLMGTMVLELCAGLVISHFDGVLQRVILLASFMPVISAISGNVGLQAAAIVVRGLDTGHVALSDWRRHISKELRTALIMALGCGLVLGVIGAFWSQHVPFGIVIGAALTCSMMTAGLMGTLIPMVSKKLGFDPATTAGPFETAFQDIIGFGVFLWLASMLESYLH